MLVGSVLFVVQSAQRSGAVLQHSSRAADINQSAVASEMFNPHVSDGRLHKSRHHVSTLTSDKVVTLYSPVTEQPARLWNVQNRWFSAFHAVPSLW